MVNIRYIPLKIIFGLSLVTAGCSVNPFQTPSGAPVEQPARPPAAKQEQRTAPQPVQEAAPPVTAPGPVQEPHPYINEQPRESAEKIPVPEKAAPAVVALLDDADQYAAAGKKTQAVASLERALRIEPKNPLLWHKLSRLRLEEKNWTQAQALAKKSNLLAPGNKGLQIENWKIIAQASAALGDKSGAERAREMIRELERD